MTTSSPRGPRNGLTIGVPLYNEARFIEAAVESAVAQGEVILVADNGSTDGSDTLCEAMSRRFSNVSFVRHEKNLGASLNFQYVFDQAATPYFMWLGGHDVLPEGYAQKLMTLLEDNPDAVLAYGATRYIDVHGGPIDTYDYLYSQRLTDPSPSVRLLGLIRHLEDCSLVHGIFRTDALRAAWAARGAAIDYYGADHVLLGRAALEGRFLYEPRTHLIRRDAHPGADTAADQVRRNKGREHAPNAEDLSLRTMQRQQYAAMVEASRDDGVAGLLQRLKARYHLVNRFGSFGETPSAFWLDRVMNRLHRVSSMRASLRTRVSRRFTHRRPSMPSQP